MKNNVDCLLIGHNEMNFDEYESSVRKMGINSCAYRDLSLNFIQYDGKLYTASDIFNLFYCSNNNGIETRKPLTLGESFSATIAYLGTYLHRRGFTFDFVNSFRDDQEQLREKLEHDNILTIGITTTLYVSPLPIFEIIEFIRKYNTTAKIIVGGPFLTNLVRSHGSGDPEVLRHALQTIGADVFVNSPQGESALAAILDAFKKNRPLDGIHNIYYKTQQGYLANPVSREDNRLSKNTVDWGLFAHRVGEFVNIRTAISCPFSCSFCGFPERAGEYQVLGVEEVEAELNRLQRIPSVKHIDIIDDTFNVPPQRFKAILRMIIKNKYPFKWYSHYRCQFADRETVELLKESGCEGVFLGIESGNDAVLQNMNKAVTVEKYREGVQLLRDYGILIYGSFIVGFPGETGETVRDTISFINQSGLDFFRAQIWYCDPITPIFNNKEEYRLEGEGFQWSHKTMNSNEAADWVDEIFLSVKEPVWVPQYNFECDALFHLFQRGMSREQVTQFLGAFNSGVEEKLKNPSRREVSLKAIREIREACLGDDVGDIAPSRHDTALERENIGFEF